MRMSDSAVQVLDCDLSLVDPHHLIRSLFQTERPLPKGTAENAVLSWLIALPSGVDPAKAAAVLEELPGIANAATGETGKLRGLLREIARYPADRLSKARRRRRLH